MRISLRWRNIVQANLLALGILAGCGTLTPTITPQPTATIQPTVETQSGVPALDPALPMVEDPSGLKYVDIAPGEGEGAKTGDSVGVMYVGYLEDGTIFDQSASPFPVTLGLGSVIPGWEQGLLGMKTGGKRRLIIPADLGYGPNGMGPIPPNATLVFDVEVVTINAQ